MLLRFQVAILAGTTAFSQAAAVVLEGVVEEQQHRRHLQGNFITCSNNVAAIPGGRPSVGACEDGWSRDGTYNYPEDFTIQSKHEIYRCEASDLRIMISNGIPDHTVTQSNPNEACEQNYMVQMPLKATAQWSNY
jgi:hypothetical protein